MYSKRYATLPVRVHSFDNIKIKGISCGKNHSLCWDIQGMIYSWGEGDDGKLGHPIEKDKDF